MDFPSIAEQTDRPYISTGHLPEPEMVQRLVSDAHQRFKSNGDGQNSQVYPALARVPRELFGICVVGTSGRVYEAGDTEHEFSIMSVSKPFVFALVCETIGPEEARAKTRRERHRLAVQFARRHRAAADGRTNPMVNAGAIATTSLVPGADRGREMAIHSRRAVAFAGRKLALNEEVYASASETNFRNRSIARLLQSYDRIYCDANAGDRSLHQAVLAECEREGSGGDGRDAGGWRRQSRHQGARGRCRRSVTTRSPVMITAGLYETSGDWLYDIGLPGKSGIGGGIVAVSPGKGGFGTFAPPLDAAGNSVKGQLAAKFLSQRLGMDLFVSQPED